MNRTDTDHQASSACFAYGSLMCDDIMTAVCGTRSTRRPATLHGYRRRAVVGATYPGVEPNADHCVQGVLYLELPDSAWPRLDGFEGEEYERRIVEVEMADRSRLRAWTYVFRPCFAHRLAPDDWDYEHFLREGKARFVADYIGFDTLQAR